MGIFGGVGFAGNSNSTFKNNRNLLKNRRKPFNKDMMPNEQTHYHRAFKDKHLSKDKLKNIKSRLQEDKRKETVRLTIILITTAGISLIIILLITYFINKL